MAPVAGLPKLPVVVDTQGRLRVTKAQRREILAALAHSGESVPQFARRTGLNRLLKKVCFRENRPRNPFIINGAFFVKNCFSTAC